MTYRELVVPGAQEVLEVFGVEPVVAEPGSTVRALTFEVDDRNSVSFSYDVAGRSVRVRWEMRDRVVLDLFREGAVRIRFHRDADRASIEVDFETDSLAGSIEVAVAPEVHIRDNLLFV